MRLEEELMVCRNDSPMVYTSASTEQQSSTLRQMVGLRHVLTYARSRCCGQANVVLNAFGAAPFLRSSISLPTSP